MAQQVSAKATMNADASAALNRHLGAMKIGSGVGAKREKAGPSSSACHDAVTRSTTVSRSQTSAYQSKKQR